MSLERSRYIPTTIESAWAAGLFEAEGCIPVRKPKSTGYISAEMVLRMRDKDVIERLQSIVGGKVNGPLKPFRAHWSPMWLWSVSNWPDFIFVAQIIRPWLKERRRTRLDEVLVQQPNHIWHSRSISHCDLPPEPSSAGYIKHNRRGEKSCDRCLKSNRLYWHKRRESKHA